MSTSSWMERASNLAYALARRSRDEARTRWSRDELASYQRARLSELVRHASERSAFYRELYGGVVRGPVELSELPVLTKSAMMGAFDRVVTDPRLRLDPLHTHVASLRGDELYQGEFRVMTSSGSSGDKAIFVYDRAAWKRGFMVGSLRMTSMAGVVPSLPRPRLATVGAPDGKHMTFRGGASMDVGLYRTQRFSASEPLPLLAAELQAYQPDFILGYPSMLALLAEQQRAGRLRISPRGIITSSEVCTETMATSIRQAWGMTPYNCLGLTETGVTALDCEAHAGLHVFEDLCIVEAVDERNQPVPMGCAGARILVTNLYNRVQPIIRFEVTDLVTLDDTPCACGRTLQRIVALDGRSDDILELPGAHGKVLLHPLRLRSLLGAAPAVVQYQVSFDGRALDVQVVLTADAGADSLPQLTAALEQALHSCAGHVPVIVRATPAIEREPGPGKLKLVRVLRPATAIAGPLTGRSNE